MADCLHCEINDVVVEFLEGALKSGESVDVVEIAEKMAESIVDLILQQDQEQQAPLLATAISALGDLYLRKSGLVEGGSEATH